MTESCVPAWPAATSRSASARLIVAIDTNDQAIAATMIRAVLPHCGSIKLGWQFFAAHGPPGIRAMLTAMASSAAPANWPMPLFLDVKLKDTPDTVGKSVTELLPLRPMMLTVHASGGKRMLMAVRQALGPLDSQFRPALFAVTQLTSLTPDDLDQSTEQFHADQLRLARLAIAAGCDGLICRGNVIREFRRYFGPAPLLAVPGCRPTGSADNDHADVITPGAAIRAGADLIIMGRPITQAVDPPDMTRQVVAAIADALG